MVCWHKASPLHCWISLSVSPECVKPSLVFLVGRNSGNGGPMKIHEDLNSIMTLTKMCSQDRGPNELRDRWAKRSAFHLHFADKKKKWEGRNQTISPALGWGGEESLCPDIPIPWLLGVRGQPEPSLVPMEEHALARPTETALSFWAKGLTRSCARWATGRGPHLLGRNPFSCPWSCGPSNT